MTPTEAAAMQSELDKLRDRAEQAERRAARAESERDQARAILARVRTSMNEAQNDPGTDGRPGGEP